jgi:hypothetical protein
MGNLATPPPFKAGDWTVDATEITILSYRGDEKRRTGYQFRIDHGVWLDSLEFTTLEDAGTYQIEVRPTILGLVQGAASDIKEVEV